MTLPTVLRRWCRLSLRGLMLLVLVVGGGLGWKLHRVRTKRQAVAAIEAAGGTVYHFVPVPWWGQGQTLGTPVDQGGPAWLRAWVGDDFFRPVVGVDLPTEAVTPATLAAVGQLDDLMLLEVGEVKDLPASGWAAVGRLPRLAHVYLNGLAVTDAVLAVVGGIRALESVRLVNVSVTDGGLAPLANLTYLKALDLAICTKLTDAGVARTLAASQARGFEKFTWTWHDCRTPATIRALAEHHPQLRKLTLNDGRIEDEDLAPIARLTALTDLSLLPCQITDAGLASLEPLENLTSFIGNFRRVSDAGMRSVGKLQNLRTLILYWAPISDPGLAHLSGLTKLTTLNLSGTRVTGSGLRSLGALQDLDWLDLSRTPVGDTGLADLVALPKLKVLYLAETSITDGAAEALSRLPTLRRLDVSKTHVTNAALPVLARIGTLKELDVSGSQINPTGIAQTVSTHPTVQIRNADERPLHGSFSHSY